MIEVKLKPERRRDLEDICAWLRSNVGKGSERFRKNTWMGTDDWFCYADYPTMDEEEEDDNTAFDEEEVDLIFVFRREEDATVFSLKWS